MRERPKPLAGAIRAKEVSVLFGSRPAISNASFSIEPGQSVAIIGPNGSGKTTLLKLIAGLLEPTTGTMAVPDAVVGYVSQHASQPQWLPLTARDVVRMGRYRERGLLGRIGHDDRQAMNRAADQLDVTDLLDRRYGDLSGGQRQRVRIAQVLAQQPNVLVLDEPITGLDLPSQQIILDLIEEQAELGVAVVITTHHLDEARHCQQVMLVAGRIVAQGTPAEALTIDNLRATYGERVLGDHRGHSHAQEMLVVDDHGHAHG